MLRGYYTSNVGFKVNSIVQKKTNLLEFSQVALVKDLRGE